MRKSIKSSRNKKTGHTMLPKEILMEERMRYGAPDSESGYGGQNWEEILLANKNLIKECDEIFKISAETPEVLAENLRDELLKFKALKEKDVATVLEQNQALHQEMLDLRRWELTNVSAIKEVLATQFISEVENLIESKIKAIYQIPEQGKVPTRRDLERILEDIFVDMTQNQHLDFSAIERDVLEPLLVEKRQRAAAWRDDCEVRDRKVAQSLMKACNEENGDLMNRIEQYYEARCEGLWQIQNIVEKQDSCKDMSTDLPMSSTDVEGKFRQMYLHILELTKIGSEVKPKRQFQFRDADPAPNTNDLSRISVLDLRKRINAQLNDIHNKLTTIHDAPCETPIPVLGEETDPLTEARAKILEVKEVIVPHALERLEENLKKTMKQIDISLHAPDQTIKRGKSIEIKNIRLAFEQEVIRKEKEELEKKKGRTLLRSSKSVGWM